MHVAASLYIHVCMFIVYYTSTSDQQPSTAIANQLPGQLVSTEIRTIRAKFLSSSYVALNDSAQRHKDKLKKLNN